MMLCGSLFIAACSPTEEPRAQDVVVPRPASLAGWVGRAPTSSSADSVAVASPSQIVLAGKTLVVPADVRTGIAGDCQALAAEPARGPERRCWAQVGLAEDQRTVVWMNSFTVLDDNADTLPARVIRLGVIASVDQHQTVLTDQTTIPNGPATYFGCSKPSTDPGVVHAGDQVTVVVDAQTGDALRVGCGLGNT